MGEKNRNRRNLPITPSMFTCLRVVLMLLSFLLGSFTLQKGQQQMQANLMPNKQCVKVLCIYGWTLC